MVGLSFVFMRGPLRKRIIAEWRGLPGANEDPDRTVSIQDVLGRLAPKLGFESRLREEEISSAWTEIVGDFFARHSQPTKLHQGMLIVNVLQPTVMYELNRQWKSLILSKLKERFGGKMIREIRFRLG